MTNGLPCAKRSRKRRPLSLKLRFQILHRDGFKCRYCGALPQEDQLHIDHVFPVCAGGTNDEDNLVTSCATCNLGKSDQILDDPDTPEEEARQVVYSLLRPARDLDPIATSALVAAFVRGESFADVERIGRVAQSSEDAIALIELLHLEGIEA